MSTFRPQKTLIVLTAVNKVVIEDGWEDGIKSGSLIQVSPIHVMGIDSRHVIVNVFQGCKESQFYTLPFEQAVAHSVASIY